MGSKPIIVIQGATWGSEAKGNIAATLCVQRQVRYAVRTGAINAGHTVVYKGKRYAMQQLPTGWVHPNTQLVIGAGAYIHPPTLEREIDMINEAMPEYDVRDRLFIDYRCGVHTDEAESASKRANRHHLIGATGKGCSEAICAKIRDRNAGYQLYLDTERGKSYIQQNGLMVQDTVRLLNDAYDREELILIEGTQGTFLDLNLGPYPFVTSRMTSAANWIAECGLSPALEYEVVLVCRTYPIRVAGNSGPMKGEIEWVDLANSINNSLQTNGKPPLVDPRAISEFIIQTKIAAASGRYQVPPINMDRPSEWSPADRQQFRVAASEMHRDALNGCSAEVVAELRKLFEMTTVTKKLRRIAALGIDDLRMSIAINRPAWICLTFLDYLEPELAGMESGQYNEDREAAMHRAYHRITLLAHDLKVPIKMVSVGPEMTNVLPASALWVRQSKR